jgi:M6 family metalloprotease-like protein
MRRIILFLFLPAVLAWGAMRHAPGNGRHLAWNHLRSSPSTRNLLKHQRIRWQGKRPLLKPAAPEDMSGGPDTLRVLGLRVQFQQDADEETTGDGRFMDSPGDSLSIDPPPHDALYFHNQLRALANYYNAVSGGRLKLETFVHPALVAVPRPMGDYASDGTEQGSIRGLAALLRDAVHVADTAGIAFSSFDCLVVFHAGVGNDVGLDYDPTPKDLASAFLNLTDLRKYLDPSDLSAEGIPVQGGTFHVSEAVLLPETETQEGYELGLLGTAALMFGFQLGLPALWDLDTGRSGIGGWGLMDQGSGNFNSLIPAQPCAFEKYLLGWEFPVAFRDRSDVRIACAGANDPRSLLPVRTVKIPIREHEYFLVENRMHDPNRDGVAIGLDALDRVVRFLPEGQVETPAPPAVIVRVDNYDFGLPGSGILIWHVDEEKVLAGLADNRVNSDPDHRGVDLEEADGAQDIGESYGMFDAGSGSEYGVMHDAWYAGNEIHKLTNRTDSVAFGTESHPNTRSVTGADSHVLITGFSDPDTVMTFTVKNTRAPPGFPVLLGRDGQDFNDPAFPPLPGDFNGDGSTDLVVVSRGGSLYGYDSDGLIFPSTGSFTVRPGLSGVEESFVTGWFGETGAPLSAPPKAWTLGGNTAMHVVCALENGEIQSWTGISDSGLPVLERVCNLAPEKAVSILVMNAGTREIPNLRIAAGTDRGRVVVVDRLGTVYWQVQVSQRPLTGLCCFGSGSPDSLVAVAEDGRIAGYGPSGAMVFERSGPAAGAPPGSPVAGRFTAGTGMEAAVSQAGGFEFIDRSGQTDGFNPPWAGQWVSRTALADMDRDGSLDLISVSDGTIRCMSRNGSLLNGFPTRVAPENAALSDPVAGDLDNDGFQEAVCATEDGRIVAVGQDGRVPTGFPLPYDGGAPVSPVLFDLDQDGQIELASVSEQGRLDVWDMDGSWTPESAPWPHPTADPSGTARSLQAPKQAPVTGDLMPERLAYNYPNPAYGDWTTIRYRLERQSRVTIEIFDLAGEKVAGFGGPGQGPADNEIAWNVRDLESGVYFCRVHAEAGGESRSALIKIAVVK